MGQFSETSGDIPRLKPSPLKNTINSVIKVSGPQPKGLCTYEADEAYLQETRSTGLRIVFHSDQPDPKP